MASGCILGECPVCKETIFEDDWEMTSSGTIHHVKCGDSLIIKFAELSVEKQIELMYGAKF